MDSEAGAPDTLLAAIRYFADPDVSLHFVADLRWPDGATYAQLTGAGLSPART